MPKYVVNLVEQYTSKWEITANSKEEALELAYERRANLAANGIDYHKRFELDVEPDLDNDVVEVY